MTSQKEMYGETKKEIYRAYAEAKEMYGKFHYLYIMAILSDAQHMIDIGDRKNVCAKHLKIANQFINKAKLLLRHYGRANENME